MCKRLDSGAGAGEYRQSFDVSYSFPCLFGQHILASGNPVLADAMDRLREPGRRKVVVCIDEGVLAARPEWARIIDAYFTTHADRLERVGELIRVPGGEQAKRTPRAFLRVLRHLSALHPCRQTAVLAIGGGSMLDMVGLAASLIHRGLRLVRMPTTVLSQNDSGIGVKNGIDAFGAKNYWGTFAPPFAVVNDFDFLETLPEPYRLGGLAEAFKVALIRDADFFGFLRRNASRLRANDPEIMQTSIRRCARLHLDHIREGGDPFEFGTARPLDFGHWSAHRIEVLSGHALGHGEAVAVGIALDSYAAWRLGHLTRTQLSEILAALLETGLPVWSPLLEERGPDGTPALRRGLEDFREHLGGRLTLTMPDGIGRGVEIHALDWGIVEDGIRHLKSKSAVRNRTESS